MARIRSVKPEFWTDGTNLGLSDSCALFFIGLWNFCDDDGKHRLDLNQLVAELGGRWHRGKVELFVSCLINSGQLRLNSDSTWIQVTGWSHQRIDKPKQPEVNSSDLQWLSLEESKKARDDSRPIHARIGSDRRDRIGSDRLQGTTTKQEIKPAKTPSVSGPTWEAYSSAYLARYQVTPVRNKTTNAQMAAFVKRIGAEEAPGVASFYLTHRDQFYVKQMHSVGMLLKDAEKLRTQWATGQQMTGTVARQTESQGHVQDQLARIAKGEL